MNFFFLISECLDDVLSCRLSLPGILKANLDYTRGSFKECEQHSAVAFSDDGVNFPIAVSRSLVDDMGS